MPQLTITQRTKLIEFWLPTKLFVQVCAGIDDFSTPLYAPNPRTIHRTVVKFSTAGNVCNVNKGHCDKKRTARSEENVHDVREVMVRSPLVASE